MNYIIIISFLVFLVTTFILIFPKYIALRIGNNINRYDLESIPRRTTMTVIFIALILLIASLIVLMNEVNSMDVSLPDINIDFLPF